MTRRALSFQDRLLAEAVRHREADGADPIIDAAAEAAAREAGGPFEQRLAARAAGLDVAVPLRHALSVTRSVILWVVAGAGVLGVVAGAVAARTTLGGVAGTTPVNIFWVLISLLGVQTLLLLLWLVLLVARPAALAGSSLGGLVVSAGQRLSGAVQRGPDQLAAVRAVAAVYGRTSLGKWSLSAVSHFVWTMFNVGCGVMVIVLLSARHYEFVWETTILSSRTYVPMTRALAVGPRAVGFAVPDETQIRASQSPPPPDRPALGEREAIATGEAWSGFLLGSLVVYGFGPRVILLGLCLGLRRRAASRYRLDTDRPGFSRLRDRLVPSTRGLGVVDPDGDGEPRARDANGAATAARTPAAPPQRPLGPPAVLGFEIASGTTPWPPPVDGATWRDLGFVDDRAGRRRVLEELTVAETTPATLLVVAELTTTPDRGVQRFLEDLRGAVGDRVALLLTAGQDVREHRGAERVEGRIEDWRAMSAQAGVADDRVIELDLEHWTGRGMGRLASLLEADGAEGAAGTIGAGAGQTDGGGIDAAARLIAEHAGAWSPEWGAVEQAELHRRIARLYRGSAVDDGSGGAGGWKGLLGAARSVQGDPVGHLRRGAERAVGLLPPRLRLSPRWVAAGALTGALGCVAAATLISPVAIGALPVWSGLGAGVAAILRPLRDVQEEETETRDDVRGLDESVRSAMLFAVLLEVQGRDEATITRLLERAFPVEADAPIDSPAAARAWLDETRHRLALALAAEGGR